MQSEHSFWVFGYGSLMWRPDFPFLDAQIARLTGWHRAMCILSVHYRGTQANPGLVLGLDRGGSCIGRAFRVAPALEDTVRARLDERELVSGVYLRRMLPIVLADGQRIAAYGYIADRSHHQYVGRNDQAKAAEMIRSARGSAGTSRDYLAATVTHLRELGIRDRRLEALLDAVHRIPDSAAMLSG